MSLISSCPGAGLPGAWLAPQFCAFELPVAISNPRSILSTGPSSLLALESGTRSVVQLSEEKTNNSQQVQYTKTVVASAPDINHGLALHGGYLYVSSSNFVYRWPYYQDEGSSNGQVIVENPNSPEIVIENINFEGPTSGQTRFGHRTRTLIFDSQDRLYVSVGSIGNVDPNSYRARIRRFVLKDNNLTLPVDFAVGEVFADGVRNEVGLAFDSFGILWGVENGADKLQRSDLGQNIYNDNPGEELHRFKEEDAGKHWGYPYCWTEFKLEAGVGGGPGTQWAWPSFLARGVVGDDSCRTDYLTPELSMQAHSAPLGITFYEWKEPNQRPPECIGSTAFPKEMDGYAMIAFHGSWNRDIPTGYKVVYVEMDENGRAVGTTQDLLKHTPPNAKWDDGFRPVDVAFDACGRLLVSSDGTGGPGIPRRGHKMVRIEYVASQRATDAPSQSPQTIPPAIAPPSGAPPSPPSTAPTNGISGEPTNATSINTRMPTITTGGSSSPNILPSLSPSTFPTNEPSVLATDTIQPATVPPGEDEPQSGSAGAGRPSFFGLGYHAAFWVGTIFLWACSSSDGSWL